MPLNTLMKKKIHTPQQIVGKLREAEKLKSEDCTIGQICQRLEVSDHTYYRWRNGYGQDGLNQVKRLKKKENVRLKKAVAYLTLDKQICQEVIDRLDGFDSSFAVKKAKPDVYARDGRAGTNCF